MQNETLFVKILSQCTAIGSESTQYFKIASIKSSVKQTMELFAKQHGFQDHRTIRFILEDGVVHGATAATMTVDRDGIWGAHYELSVTDVRGRRHHFQGAPIASGLWECYGCVGVPNVLNRWIADDGRTGYGEVQEAWFYDNYLRLRAASQSDAP